MKTQETFFRPEAVHTQALTLPAAMYNRLRLLFSRNHHQPVFVPIRSMQYQAVLDADEVIFVDSLGGYQIANGVGGRLITLAWQGLKQPRAEIHQPCTVQRVDYRTGLDADHRRLLGELPRSLQQQYDKQQPSNCDDGPAEVISIISLKNAKVHLNTD